MALKCKTRINFYKSVSGTPAPCYLGLWVQYHSESLKHHKHRLCPDDLSGCIGGTTQKFIVVRPAIPIVWPIQEGINLTKKEVTIFKKAGFSFEPLHINMFKVYLASNLLVQAIPMCLI
jgi:hypothetical protein